MSPRSVPTAWLGCILLMCSVVCATGRSFYFDTHDNERGLQQRNPSDSASLLGDIVTDISENDRGPLWVDGTKNLARLDPASRKHWIDAGDRHDATHTNLAADTYHFRVRASNAEGVLNEREAGLTLTIIPPWWRSRAMLGVYAACGIALLVLAWRIFLRRREAERRHHTELERRDERFRMALWGSGDEFWDLDLRTHVMHRIGGDQNFGGSYEQTADDHQWLHEMTHPDDFPMLMKQRTDHLQGLTPIFESEYRVRDPAGEWIWRLSRGKVVEWDADRKPVRVCGTARNVTETHLADRQQRIAAEVINSMTEAVCVTDLDFRCVTINPAFTHMTGYTEAEMLGQSAALLQNTRRPTVSYQTISEEYVRNGHWRGEAWQRRKDGEEFLGWLEIGAVYDAAGTRTHYVSVITDITDRKRAEQDLRYLANYDPLTGLPNRSLLIERLGTAVERARRDGLRVAILFIDLDRFKHVNDSLGHISGDLMLRAVGQRLRSCVSDTDTVARIGGDEFTLLIEHLRDPVEAQTIARKIISVLASPVVINSESHMTITPSIGISVFPDDASAPMSLLKFADTAMYHAKEQGRNTYAVYTPAMDTVARQWANTVSALRKALERKELRLVYQPKLSLRDDRITGVEALLRWRSAELGEIPPGHFIPMAEQTGIIVEIGDFVIESACTQIRRWREEGLADVSMAINVSVLQLLRGGLSSRLRRVLAEHAIDPSTLQLELTESMLMAKAEQALSTLDELKTLGVSLAIDDFGTGYSSLSYLKRLPIDTLKIDRAFVGDITTDPDDKAITATIITMAHSLQLKVVAEGVETAEQLEYLREQGCDEIQGHWLSRPLSPEVCSEFLRSRSQTRLQKVAG